MPPLHGLRVARLTSIRLRYSTERETSPPSRSSLGEEIPTFWSHDNQIRCCGIIIQLTISINLFCKFIHSINQSTICVMISEKDQDAVRHILLLERCSPWVLDNRRCCWETREAIGRGTVMPMSGSMLCKKPPLRSPFEDLALMHSLLC